MGDGVDGVFGGGAVGAAACRRLIGVVGWLGVGNTAGAVVFIGGDVGLGVVAVGCGVAVCSVGLGIGAHDTGADLFAECFGFFAEVAAVGIFCGVLFYADFSLFQ